MNFRKQLVVLAGLILLVATFSTLGTGSAIGQSGPGAGTAPELEGTWITTVALCNYPGGDPPPLEGVLHSFARGGVALIGVPFPSQGVGQGVWTRLGPNRFGFTVEMFWFDATGQGRTKVKEIIEVRGDEYHSVESTAVDTYPDGHTVAYCAVTHGTRMKVEPPEPLFP